MQYFFHSLTLSSYFILWLKEYTAKYREWAANSRFEREMPRQYRVQRPAPNSSQLAMFYTRAKQTFFMPNSAYELDVPSVILAPFHASDLSQHPDPILFNEISYAAHEMLKQSLDRFVRAQLNNVGTNRVLCGIIAGVLFCLLGSIAPLVVNFTHGYARWSRLAAFPGLWFGLTVLLAALNGICLSVYILGDLRQLHRFELARPSISKPQPLCTHKRPSISLPLSTPPPPPTRMVPLTHSSRVSPLPPPPVHVAPSRLSRTSTRDSWDRDSNLGSSTNSSCGVEDTRIEVSGAYYDADPVDGPATSPITPESVFQFPSKNHQSDVPVFNGTATFIHPYHSSSKPEFDYEAPMLSPDERQPVSPFDFDALPTRSAPRYKVPSGFSPPEHGIVDSPPPARITAKTLAERFQLKFSVKRWTVISPDIPPMPQSSFGNGSGKPTGSTGRIDPSQKHWNAVPAFASLTPVLSPVVIRGQWEIVVRSLVISFVITWIILGSLLAVPVAR